MTKCTNRIHYQTAERLNEVLDAVKACLHSIDHPLQDANLSLPGWGNIVSYFRPSDGGMLTDIFVINHDDGDREVCVTLPDSCLPPRLECHPEKIAVLVRRGGNPARLLEVELHNNETSEVTTATFPAHYLDDSVEPEMIQRNQVTNAD